MIHWPPDDMVFEFLYELSSPQPAAMPRMLTRPETADLLEAMAAYFDHVEMTMAANGSNTRGCVQT